MLSFEFRVICLTETWCTENVENMIIYKLTILAFTSLDVLVKMVEA